MSISQDELIRLLSYDELTGFFNWKVNRGLAKKGASAGNDNGKGYLQVRVNYKNYMAHRLAFLYLYGQLPDKELDVDHINGDKKDNRICNLRIVTRSINKENIRKCQSNNKSGLLGVCYYKNRKKKPWCANISINGKIKNLGYFAHAEDAHEAYLAAKREHHPGFTL